MIVGYLRLPRSRRRLLRAALAALWRARRVMKREGYPACMARLGEAGPAEAPQGEPDPSAREVRWAVRAVKERVPWKVTCLMEALAAAELLDGLDWVVLVGAKRGEDVDIHAWLMQGELVVTGWPMHRGFAAVAAYRTPGSSNNIKRDSKRRPRYGEADLDETGVEEVGGC